MVRAGLMKLVGILIAAATLATAGPAMAQFSDSYNFLKAVRDKDGAKVTELIESGGGSTLINTRDYGTGESALHIVVKRRDDLWLRFLLGKGANPNLRDREGSTPLIAAVQISFPEAVATLVGTRADVNLANERGETPLIIAVQRRDVASVRLLLEGGADPTKADHIAGMSARDYAERDTRSTAILRLIDDAAKKKAAKPATAGPRL